MTTSEGSDEIDPADVEESRRIMREIRSGRMKTVPAEQVLEMLDRMAASDEC